VYQCKVCKEYEGGLVMKVRQVKEVRKSGIGLSSLMCCGYGWSVLFFVVSTAGGYVW